MRQRDNESRHRLRERVRSEFDEMPGLSLTVDQARRLLALDEGTCSRVLEELVRDGVLRLTPNGCYGRHGQGT